MSRGASVGLVINSVGASGFPLIIGIGTGSAIWAAIGGFLVGTNLMLFIVREIQR